MSDSKKTKFIFYQGGNNTRIGNTLVWLESAYSWCNDNGFSFLFPQVENVFSNVLDRNAELFQDSIGSFGASSVNPILELLKGVPQKLDSLLIESEPGIHLCEIMSDSLLYIDFKGREWNPSPELIDYFSRFDTIFVNEPFPFLTGKRSFKLLKLSPIAMRYIEKLESDYNNSLISVHIRQGDYKRWNGGKYYRDDRFYNELIANLSKKFPEMSVKFMHNGEFTADSNNLNLAADFDKNNLLTGEMSDFLAIATSNVIVGPLSTFTAQARNIGRNYLGKEPKLIVIEPEDNISSLLDKVKGAFKI